MPQIDVKDFVIALLLDATRRGGFAATLGRAGLAGMMGAGAIPGMSGLSGQAGRMMGVGPTPTAATMALGWAGAAVEIAKLPGQFRDLGAAVVESQRHFAKYNGAIAVAYANLDVNRMMREMRTGQDVAASATAQASAQNKLEEALRPWEAARQTLVNSIVGAIEDGLGDFVKGINDALGIANPLDTQTEGQPVGWLINAMRTNGEQFNPPRIKTKPPSTFWHDVFDFSDWHIGPR